MAQLRRSECPKFTRYELDRAPPFLGSFTPTNGDRRNPKHCDFRQSKGLPTMNSAEVCSKSGVPKGAAANTITVATEEGYVKLPVHAKGSVSELSYAPQVSTLELVTHAYPDTSLSATPLRFYP